MTDNAVHEMSQDECWEKLSATHFGRIATAVAGEVSITPFNFVVHDGKLVFRTAEGTKLVGLVVNSSVAVEIDEVGESTAWSVIGKGTARMIDSFSERHRFEEIELRPWVDTVKEIFVEVTLDEVTGRSFDLTR